MLANSDFSRFGLMPRDGRRYPCVGSVQAVSGVEWEQALYVAELGRE